MCEFAFEDESIEFAVESNCIFKNTRGMRCQRKAEKMMECCEYHQCMYIFDTHRCEDVVTCKSKYYCELHSKICACEHQMEDGRKCGQSIYYAYRMKGINYCQEHACRFTYCAGERIENCDGQCLSHYISQVYCGYIYDDGSQCKEVIGRLPATDAEKNEMMCIGDVKIRDETYKTDERIRTMDQLLYCVNHVCCVSDCGKCRINDNTPWCERHSKRCEYIDDKGIKCNGYYKVARCCDDDRRVQCKLCEKHRCQWRGHSIGDTMDCCEKIEKHDECEKYCAIHYVQYIFYKYEFE